MLPSRSEARSILGVPGYPSEDEIERAYRELCMRLHPDKGGDKAAFVQAQHAYDVLMKQQG